MEVDADTAISIGATDSYGWHKRLWDCFPGESDCKRDFLTRIDPLEGSFRIWAIAHRKPTRPAWCPNENFALKEIAPSFLSHRYYAFDLRANPIKTQTQRGPNGETLLRKDGKRKQGKRVPLTRKEDLRAWIDRKGATKGFRILDDKPLEIGPMVVTHFSKKNQFAYHGGVQFRGVLEVTDSTQFVEAYYSGIGSAKSFGFGLLLIAPIIA
jgi:CRISPR system Cascade subunit CasE